LIHVVDISHPQFEEQIEVVNKTLAEVCQSADKPMIVVFNKIDAYTHTPKDDDDLTERTRENIPLEELKQTWMNRLSPGNCVFVSAKAGTNIDELKDKIYTKAREIHAERFPYNDFLYQRYDQDMDTLS
ncbi:MAG: GTPase HflX, partial [Muribaculaceae bacterium]|nr:GTPase HflX [Muribaculaceae bacterium]